MHILTTNATNTTLKRLLKIKMLNLFTPKKIPKIQVRGDVIGRLYWEDLGPKPELRALAVRPHRPNHRDGC